LFVDLTVILLIPTTVVSKGSKQNCPLKKREKRFLAINSRVISIRVGTKIVYRYLAQLLYKLHVYRCYNCTVIVDHDHFFLCKIFL